MAIDERMQDLETGNVQPQTPGLYHQGPDTAAQAPCALFLLLRFWPPFPPAR